MLDAWASGPNTQERGNIVLKRLVLSLAGLMVGLTMLAPTAAYARMHFTTTNERLSALDQRAKSSVALTNPAEIQTQLNEITTQAQAAKAAAEEAASRPASNADDKSVLAMVGTEMDGVVASANRAKTATGADQKSALDDIAARSARSLSAVQARIQFQLAQPLPSPSPSVLPTTGLADVGPSPALWLLGLVFVVIGLGVLTVARRRHLA